MKLTSEVLQVLKNICGSATKEKPVPLHEPYFRNTNCWEYVRECIDTGWVSSTGKWVNRFEEELCTYTGAKYAVAVVNGTVALRLALHEVGVRASDEVLVSPLSFVATTNAIVHVGATPHFVDIEGNSLGMDPKALAIRLEHVAKKEKSGTYNKYTGKKIAAIVPVHVFGHPAPINKITEIAQKWDLPVVEDAAEALGSWRKGQHCGLFGDVGCLSFNDNKLITTGGGGALITNNKELAEHARHLSTTAKVKHPWLFEHDEVGWNDRMPNINAALGVAQIELLSRRLRAKQEIAEHYKKEINKLSGVKIIEQPNDCKSNYWLITMKFTHSDKNMAMEQRDDLLHEAHEEGYLLRPAWTPLHKLQINSHAQKGDLSVTEDESSRLINLPSSPQILRSFEQG